ncbi:hypothetical protein MRB53_030734 [Persea americana]|uniref:Uncharacterized protein n=1 Tax=Persea americana TaxID=3435 RepID=A0ACC2KM26_PERAE|nr:hypothetical protein MRB53_030734 [Persea americana]
MRPGSGKGEGAGVGAVERRVLPAATIDLQSQCRFGVAGRKRSEDPDSNVTGDCCQCNVVPERNYTEFSLLKLMKKMAVAACINISRHNNEDG